MFNLLYCIFEKHIVLEAVYVTAWVPCSILLNHVTLLGWGRGGIAAPGVRTVVCKEENKEKLSRNEYTLGGKQKAGPRWVVCPTHFPEEKLALRIKEDYFAYFMFSF